MTRGTTSFITFFIFIGLNSIFFLDTAFASRESRLNKKAKDWCKKEHPIPPSTYYNDRVNQTLTQALAQIQSYCISNYVYDHLNSTNLDYYRWADENRGRNVNAFSQEFDIESIRAAQYSCSSIRVPLYNPQDQINQMLRANLLKLRGQCVQNYLRELAANRNSTNRNQASNREENLRRNQANSYSGTAY